MTKYLVTWEAEIEAEAPHDAAERALELIRCPEAQETVFSVFLPEKDEAIIVDAALPGED